MEQAVRFLGGLVAIVVACLVVAVALQWLHGVMQRSGNRHALPLLRLVLTALIAAPLADGLPLLHPALAPWHALTFGACFGLVYGAIQNGGSMRLRDRTAEEPRP